MHLNLLIPASATENVASLLGAKTLCWSGRSWSTARYRASTLQSTEYKQNAPVAAEATFYPPWFGGYHAIKYKFIGASFPQGRKVLLLQTAGAGLGTCMSLPNVGYNPPVHAIHFICDRGAVYEDLAYNWPRRFEAFWPDAKVLSVQTNGGREQVGSDLSAKCFVTGEGCTSEVNQSLHFPASRVAMDFNAPARGGGRLTQSTDITIIDCSTEILTDVCNTVRSFSQYNINQDIQTYYKEIISWQKLDDSIIGKIRVATFLPYYVRGMDVRDVADKYDENQAVALYDYKMTLASIDQSEAASL